MDINKALGKAIATHRKGSGVTQMNVPYDQGSLSKIENGKQSLSMEKLLEVTQAIGTTPSAVWATAEEILAENPPSAKNSQAHKSAFLEALTSLVEAAIDRAPKILPELRMALELLASRGSQQERKLVRALASLVEKQMPSAHQSRLKRQRG